MALSKAVSARRQLAAEFRADPWRAHAMLFKRRHPEASAPAHADMIRAIYDDNPRLLIEGFRGMAKSTYLEETALLKAVYGECHNLVIVGSSYTRACERLDAIKNEIAVNEMLFDVFGRLRGRTWQAGQIVLSNGACIQALGRDQQTLGIKYLDWRPDAALVDDVEDPEEVRDDIAREKTWLWFIRTFLPALDHPLTTWVRVLGTRRGNGSLPERLENDGWKTRKYPIKFIDREGQLRATWPAKFPLDAIAKIEKTYAGDMTTFNQEYMCQAEHAAERTFNREMFRYDPNREPSWHAVYCMYDPARTTNRESATTGKAVFSWIGRNLVVWEWSANRWQPSEIIDDMFDTQARYPGLVKIGFEEDGLNEWARQPIRQEQARRGITLPVVPMRAPRGQLDFIAGLQVYFDAREVVFVERNEVAEAQLLSFRTGKRDAPNALAYARVMRPPAPLYDNFSDDHIVYDLEPHAGSPLYLASNAVSGLVTAVLCQLVNGQLRILADYVREGLPQEVAGDIHAEAALEGDTTRPVRRKRPTDWVEGLKNPDERPMLLRQPVRWVCGPQHYEGYSNVGLVQAASDVPASVSRGGLPDRGRGFLAQRLALLARGEPALVVSERASWTLRGFVGGYTRGLTKSGALTGEAEAGPYRCLMEGLESFAAMMAGQDDDDVDNLQPVSYDARGVPYASAMPARRR